MNRECTWSVKRVTGRNEFRTQTSTHECGKPVEEGAYYCPRHEALAAKQRAAAEFKQQQRAARAAREARKS